MSGVVRTVRSDVPAESIGRIAFHEHLLFDLVRPAERGSVDDAPITASNRWQIDYRSNENRNNARQRDHAIAAGEMAAFSADGGALLVDQSTYGIGRDPVGQVSASSTARIHVVAAAGTYVAAHLEPAMLALDTRTVICHMDRTFSRGERVAELLARGVCVEWDFFGVEQLHYWFGDVELPTDLQRLHLIAELMERGWGDRIIVSHDICTCTLMTHWGGHGYGHLLRNGPTLMRRAGLSEDQIDQLLRRNPLRLLTLAAPILKQD